MKELLLWQRYYRQEMFPADRIEVMLAEWMSFYGNSKRGKESEIPPFKLTDFLLINDRKKEEPAEKQVVSDGPRVDPNLIAYLKAKAVPKNGRANP